MLQFAQELLVSQNAYLICRRKIVLECFITAALLLPASPYDYELIVVYGDVLNKNNIRQWNLLADSPCVGVKCGITETCQSVPIAAVLIQSASLHERSDYQESKQSAFCYNEENNI
ncbi:hypothetical protein NECAME_00299 [Necator americanus]|uniref:Uncharacterized protein n=1 Tax=Necator americanus TaxID=51031 RepID=W2TJG9_NECAM|nr:hypothetical protein NECAME_00299 [Necator americanus]ETN81948.1 hypothetical protein NECAME_00299 [Necator americanus]